MKIYEHIGLGKSIGSFFVATIVLQSHPRKFRLDLYAQDYGSWEEMKPYCPEESIKAPIQALNCMKQIDSIMECLK